MPAGLTPGGASSVAPSGIPGAPTGAVGPMPSGEVTPSAGGNAPIVTCAEAAALPSSDKVAAAIKTLFTDVLQVNRAQLRGLTAAGAPKLLRWRSSRGAAPGMRLKTNSHLVARQAGA